MTPSEQSSMEPEFSRLAWELARRARFDLDETRSDRPIRATIATATAGDVKAWGWSCTQAMRNLAYGLDQMAADWAGRPITESVATGPTITSPNSCSTERTEAARAAVQRSDEAALHVAKKTGPEIETMELRSAVRALIQEAETLRAEVDALRQNPPPSRDEMTFG